MALPELAIAIQANLFITGLNTILIVANLYYQIRLRKLLAEQRRKLEELRNPSFNISVMGVPVELDDQPPKPKYDA